MIATNNNLCILKSTSKEKHYFAKHQIIEDFGKKLEIGNWGA